MAYFCRRCRKPLRCGGKDERTLHVRCEIHPLLADDILMLLRVPLSVPIGRLASDFSVSYKTMFTALKMAARRRREMRVAA